MMCATQKGQFSTYRLDHDFMGYCGHGHVHKNVTSRPLYQIQKNISPKCWPPAHSSRLWRRMWLSVGLQPLQWITNRGNYPSRHVRGLPASLQETLWAAEKHVLLVFNSILHHLVKYAYVFTWFLQSQDHVLSFLAEVGCFNFV